jgi:hypothetical protein
MHIIDNFEIAINNILAIAKNINIDSTSVDSINEYNSAVQKLFAENDIPAIPFAYQNQSSKEFGNLKVYRVRKYDGQWNPNLLSEFTHPPISKCKTFERANYPLHPVFYCSPDIKTSIAETASLNFNSDDGEIFFISEWGFNDDEKFREIYYKTTR